MNTHYETSSSEREPRTSHAPNARLRQTVTVELAAGLDWLPATGARLAVISRIDGQRPEVHWTDLRCVHTWNKPHMLLVELIKMCEQIATEDLGGKADVLLPARAVYLALGAPMEPPAEAAERSVHARDVRKGMVVVRPGNNLYVVTDSYPCVDECGRWVIVTTGGEDEHQPTDWVTVLEAGAVRAADPVYAAERELLAGQVRRGDLVADLGIETWYSATAVEPCDEDDCTERAVDDPDGCVVLTITDDDIVATSHRGAESIVRVRVPVERPAVQS